MTDPVEDALTSLLELIAPPDDIHRVDDWVFTFGPVHVHPVTGAPLRDRYIRIHGTWVEARRRMLMMFGQKWSHQSPGVKAAEYEREYGNTELPESEWPKR